MKNNKPLFPLAEKLLKVEEFAERLFRANGYEVFKGEDVHFFFSILSFNFKRSFFFQVYRNWVGEDAEEQLLALEATVSRCLSEACVSDELISLAESALAKYYTSYPRKLKLYSALVKHVRVPHGATPHPETDENMFGGM